MAPAPHEDPEDDLPLPDGTDGAVDGGPDEGEGEGEPEEGEGAPGEGEGEPGEGEGEGEPGEGEGEGEPGEGEGEPGEGEGEGEPKEGEGEPAESPECGDGIVEGDEVCDDGDMDDTDDCMSGCTHPAPLTRTFGPVSLQPNPMRPIINIYLVSPGGALQAELAYDQLGTPDSAGDLRPTDPYPTADHFATIRVFDPDEQVVHWHAQAQAAGAEAPEVRPSPVEPPPASLRFERGAMRGYRISLARAGVHQIRIATNSLKGAVALRLPDGVGWGFAIPSGRLLWPLCGEGCASEAASLFAWAPRHRTAALLLNLEVTGGAVPVTRLGDAAPMNARNPGAAYVVPPGHANDGEVWRLDLPALAPAAQRVTVGASGLPLILCDSATTARSVRASVVRVVAADGAETLVSHNFQREILELLPQLAAYAGDDATSDRLNDSADVAAVAQSEACLGSPQAPLSPDEVWRRTTLLHSYDNPLRAVRFYLSRATLSEDSVSYGNTIAHSLRGLEFDGTSHFAGGVGLHLLHRQICREDAECVNGSQCSGGRCEEAFRPDRARWDVLRGLRYTTRDGAQYLPAFTGLGLPSQAAAQLTRAATWSHPCNPWGPEREGGPIRNPELLARAAMQGLSDLLTFGEDERQLSIGDTDPYPGSIAFQLPQFTRAFMTTAPALERHLATEGEAAAQLGRRVRQVWADGLRRALDRNAPAYLVSTLNQSSHTLLALADFARGAEGLPIAALYRQEARAFASRFAAAAGPAGWLPEDSGPDASYSGISHWHMAQYLEVTDADAEGPDDTLRAALARSYRFLSHFSAEEPDGQRTSSTNFSHRTTIGFDREQYHGALGVAEDVPEVAAWSAWRFPSGGATLTEARASLPGLAALFATGDVGAPPRQSLYGLAAITDSLDGSTRVAPALLPSARAGLGPFETLLPAPEINGRAEALAIGRPAYYAALYFGRPRGVLGSNQAQYWGTLRSTNPLVTREDVPPVDTRTDPFVHYRTLTPMVGGGLSILSTPTFGSAVVAAGWSPLTHHGLVVELMEDGVARRYWEDYEQVSTEPPAEGDCADVFPDADHQALPGGFSVYGRIEGRAGRPELWHGMDPGLCYARHYTFDADAVRVRVVLAQVAPAATEVVRLFENIPVPTCTRAVCDARAPTTGARNRKSQPTTLAFAAEHPDGETRVELRSVRAPDAGLDVILPAGNAVWLRPHGLRDLYYGEELQIGRIEVDIEAPGGPGTTSELEYVLMPRL